MKSLPDDRLNVVERGELERCEREIEAHREGFLKVGNALTVILKKRLYRETHNSFEAYCKERWEISKPYAHQLIEGAAVVGRIRETVAIATTARPGSGGEVSAIATTLPANEAQARPLTKLPPKEQPKAWKEAVRTAPKGEDGKPKVTARHVEQVVAKRIEPKEDAPAEPPVRVVELPESARTVKNGSEFFPRKVRQDASKHWGKFIRTIDKCPAYNALKPHLNAISEALQTGNMPGRKGAA